MKKLSIILVILTLLLSVPFLWKVNNDNKRMVIGVMNDQQIELYKNYFRENNILHCPYEFKCIANDLPESKDPFQYTLEDIKNGFLQNEYDMIIGIDEDYILPLLDDRIFYDMGGMILNKNVSPCIKNFCKKHTQKEIYYIPSAISNIRVLLINNDIFSKLNISIPKTQLSLEDFVDLCYLVDEKLKQNNMTDYYALSLGSAIDEYLSDDIYKLLLPLKDSIGNEHLYIENYLKLVSLAKQVSYSRKDIGYQLPLDFAFKDGKTAMKICTTFELYNFLHFDQPFQDTDYRITEFDFSTLPVPFVNKTYNYTNAEIKVMCINKTSPYIDYGTKIAKFFFSKEHAINTLQFKNPFTQNIISFPLYIDNDIQTSLQDLYHYSNFYYGCNLPTYYFEKKQKNYWNRITQNKEMLDQYITNQISENNYKKHLHNVFENHSN